ncbi:hypothetical protein [Dinghuibacter silviterrae]|uniref:Uncharacterized protein n=1 Tax=Dinghuibacter silviterrae TaxID=1539049 RepID=A0A4V3GM30_9BACT|nr:hypothetical protein [Dinghuibacter silviterrae]TDX01813.1 hypothetical protein EDB95_2856 [Dinghuibacter silviterrae]
MLKAPVYPPIAFDERPAAREELLREYERKRNAFNSAFSSLVQTEIHPALHRFLDQVRDQGHHLELDAGTQEKFEQYLHRSYSVRLRGHHKPVVFTFAGNYDHRKVFIYTEFNESTTINVYDPSQINEPLLERIVLKGLGKIVSAA